MWKVSYGVAPLSDPATGTIVDVSSKPYNLSMLTGQTTYDWYVRADCGGGDLSTWSTKNTFTTLIDCASAIELTCSGSVTSGNLAASGGQWNLTTCYSLGTPGKEKVYRFTPTLTGTHTLNITNVNGGSGYIDYFYKIGSSCSSSGRCEPMTQGEDLRNRRGLPHQRRTGGPHGSRQRPLTAVSRELLARLIVDEGWSVRR